MRTGGRAAAAIEILDDFERRRVPLKIAVTDWARGARYAGAKDRAWISGLCLDALRRRRSLAFAMGDDSPRAAVLAALKHLWGCSIEEIAAAAEAPHGPGALSEAARAALAEPLERRLAGAPLPVRADFPDWIEPQVMRTFAGAGELEMRALAERADVDLRINTLRTTRDKALAALNAVGAQPSPLLENGARIAAPAASERAPDVTVIPAFHKGWVEVQDAGSQIAAGAAGAIRGAQVLDYCAGGGGKTLALAALMENTGQLYAYDLEPQRLKPLYERARRAGVRNLQIRNPAGGDRLDDLEAKMDFVFVDAPCTGSGTWRRHPDAKWRLTPQQLGARIAEQDAILAAAAPYVRPGGALAYVTCSVFMEENEDRVSAFRAAHREFEPLDVLAALAASGVLAGRASLDACRAEGGALRITPARVRADGFYIAALRRA